MFIDEIDRVSADSGVATFFKLSAEKLSREGLTNLGFICAGIMGAAQNQYSSNINNLITRGDKGIYCFVNPLLKEYIKNFGIIDFTTKEDEVD